MAQLFKFPMEYMRVTQGENSTYSHAGSLAMDFGGRDTGADRLFCPCDMVVKRTRKNANGELYLESVEKVQFADGTSDYARLLCIHDSSFNVKEGQIVKQGEYFYDEGGMGSGNPKAFANHVHIEAGKGKWKSTTQSRNSKGTYVIENQRHLYDLFVVGADVQMLNDGGYLWKTESNMDKNILFGEYIKHDFAVDCKECEALVAEMKQMKENHKAELNGCFETIDGYIRDVHQLEEQKAQLKTENGVLKETIISMQEQLAEARKPKSFWEKILTIFLGE